MATLTDEQLADLKQKAMECSKRFSADQWVQFTVIYVAGRHVSLRDYLEAATPQTILALLQRIGELEAATRCPCHGCPDETDGDPGTTTCHQSCPRLAAFLASPAGRIEALEADLMVAQMENVALEAELAVERAAVEVLADAGEFHCSTEEAIAAARTDARKRLGLGEEVQSGPD